MTSDSLRQRAFWIAWLQVVLSLLVVYALVLVFLGALAEELFSLFGFGPPDGVASVELSTYMKLPFAVLGSVMVGWAALMLILVRGPLTSGAQWVVPALAVSLALWFLLDTGMSIILAYPTHALFNVPFALALGAPFGDCGRSIAGRRFSVPRPVGRRSRCQAHQTGPWARTMR